MTRKSPLQLTGKQYGELLRRKQVTGLPFASDLDAISLDGGHTWWYVEQTGPRFLVGDSCNSESLDFADEWNPVDTGLGYQVAEVDTIAKGVRTLVHFGFTENPWYLVSLQGETLDTLQIVVVGPADDLLPQWNKLTRRPVRRGRE